MNFPTAARSRALLVVAALAIVIVVVFVLVRLGRRANPSPPEEQAVDVINRSTDLPMVAPIKRDFAAIKERGTLTVLAPYNSTTYFLYRGEPLGYEFELLREFAKERDLDLRMVVVTDRKSLYSLLNSGEGDIAAARLVPTEDDRRDVAFTRALYRTEPALVQQEAPPGEANLPEAVEKALQHAPDEELPEVEINARLITRPAQLANETVTLPEKSEYKRTLIELSDEISGDIHVVEAEAPLGDEALAKRVAAGDVDFTVMQSNLAALKEAEFTNLKVRPVVGRTHSVAWAVRRNAPQLLAELNAWIEEKKNETIFSRLYGKYFVDRRSHRERVASEYLTSATGKLCQYDELLKRHAAELQWDWRLLASQAFQESRFKPDARSWAGATGLLQLMPRTAQEFGVRDARDPEENVQGAVRFLKWLTNYWSKRIDDEGERLKFVLASYNTGAGHVEDAQRLTEKYGGDPRRWDDVSYWLLQKSTQQYAADPVVKFGFCRGVEPVTYVSLILERFDHYKQFVVTETARATRRSAQATKRGEARRARARLDGAQSLSLRPRASSSSKRSTPRRRNVAATPSSYRPRSVPRSRSLSRGERA
ncbi:MAG TPA: transglycosylase SLT domain-containing protein [Pyrinomonadaceae bacterium]|nr:transglycosylase SLT domain-containing protein [Pyrinomonadaceae bacterium]